MKKILTLIIIIFFNILSAQNPEELSPYQKVLYTADNIQVAPEFTGGEKKFDEYIRTNFANSKVRKGTEISASFIVEMDGTVSNGIATKKRRLFTLLIFHFAGVIIPFRLVFCIQ